VNAARPPLRPERVRVLAAALVLASAARGAPSGASNGINLPPTQGTTNAGAFRPGVYDFDYSNELLDRLAPAGFDSIRVPVNAETARRSASLTKLARCFARVGNRGIVCFFDTRRKGDDTHGDGKPNDLAGVARAWKAVHARFAEQPGIAYELFNEPFGYPRTLEGARQYVRDMREVIRRAGLPADRCILDGLGYANDVRLVAQAGWDGQLAYHFYPNWVPEGRRTQENFSNKVQDDLRGLSARVHVTEFGASLEAGDVYGTYTADGSDAAKDRNALRGFHDAVLALRRAGAGVRSTYHWHGWPNGDSYDVWAPENRFGAAKIHAIQRDD